MNVTLANITGSGGGLVKRSYLAVSMSIALTACQSSSGGGGYGGFQLQSASGASSYAYRMDTSPDGSRAERFEVRPGDCPVSTGDCRDDRERSEKSENKPASPLGKEFWYHFSVFVPADWPNTSPLDTKLGQFHQYGDGKPPVLFKLHNNSYIFELSDPAVKQSDPMRPKNPLREIHLVSASAMKGRWTNVLVNARWSMGEDGFVRVWVNGTQKVNHTGPNADRSSPVNFKYGIYRSFISRYGGRPHPTLVAWYKNVRKGSTRESVTPSS